MSYLVLARKYRPRSFTEMVGQEHVVQALSNALTQQRLHHAYLFTGTRGVGKTTVSRILAKSLNCLGADGQGGITAEPCGVCQACRDIDEGRFVDYTELDAASNRGVDEVQSLLEQAVYKPVQGRFKVFMIDEVHMLTNTAFNAMLKTLEEPPEYLKFVLATTDPQKVPVTVLSRCLQFNLRPMAPQTVFEHLQRVLAAESLVAEPGALQLLARAARGSMRDALSLTDQAIAYGGGQLLERAVRQMLGSVDRSHVLQLIAALAQADGAQVVALVEALRQQGVSAATTLEDMSLVLQRMAVLQAVPQAHADPDAQDPDARTVAELAAALGPQETQLLYSLCLHGRTELGLAPDEYAALTMVLLRLLAFLPSGTSAEKKSLKSATEGPAAAAPVAGPSHETSSGLPLAGSTASPVATSAAPLPASAAGTDPAGSPLHKGLVVGVDVGSHVQAPSPSPASAPARTTAPVLARQSAPAPAAGALSRPTATQPSPESPDSAGAPAWPAADDSEEARLAAAELALAALADDQAPVPAHAATSAAPPVQGLPVLDAGLPSTRLDTPRHAQQLVPTAEGDFWASVVQSLVDAEAVTALVRELALQSQLIAREDGRWTLSTESESLNKASTRERLQAALQAQGHAVQLQVQVGPVSDSPARRQAVRARERQQAAQALIEQDPLVQALVRDYGARIVPGSVRPI